MAIDGSSVIDTEEEEKNEKSIFCSNYFFYKAKF